MFRVHAVAVYEDKTPLGTLNLDDLVAHQLNTYPEVIKLKEIEYITERFKVMKCVADKAREE